jgi:hypothetical protein
MEAPPAGELCSRQNRSFRLVEGDGGKSGDNHFAGADHPIEFSGSKVSRI